MKSKLILLFILVVLFILFIIMRFFILDRQNVFGSLKVISSPVASVFVDNVAVGKTPLDNYKLKIGDYQLKLIPEGTATDTASWNGKISVYKNALTYVNRELGVSDVTSAGEIFTTRPMNSPIKDGYGEVYVETDPPGAIVTLDNDDKGVASLIMQDVPKGEHEISVFMPGFLRRTQKVNIDSGYRVSAYIKLAIDQTQSSLTPTPTPAPSVATASAQTEPASTGQPGYVTINNTDQGWLRVRDDASINASEEAKIKSGGKYKLLDEQTNWYKIQYNDNPAGLVSGTFTTGWISAEYATKE